MYKSTIKESPASVCFLEQRAQHLDSSSYLVAVTKMGAGRILDISDRGLTFGCLYPHYFPNELDMDILDSKSNYIKDIKVRKMRECFKASSGRLVNYELLVGVEFIDPTDHQIVELDCLLDSPAQDVVPLPDILYIPEDPDQSFQLIAAINSIACQRQLAE